MAPKKKKPAPPPKPPKASPKLLKKKLDKAIAETDRWKGLPPASCDSCDQKTGTIDRNSPPLKRKFLHWVHWDWAVIGKKKKKMKVPTHKECYPCYKLRRKFFPTLSQKQLVTKREEVPKVDQQFWIYREDDVGEIYKFKMKACGLTAAGHGSQPATGPTVTSATLARSASAKRVEKEDEEEEKRQAELRRAQDQLKKCLEDEDYTGAAAVKENIAALMSVVVLGAVCDERRSHDVQCEKRRRTW